MEKNIRTTFSMALFKHLVFILCMLSTIAGYSQDHQTINKGNKGKLRAYWGWNRGWYSKSDIRFDGNQYNIELKNVKAKDRPSKFGLDPYFHPARVTVPQTNCGLGYYLNDNTILALNLDHMKYVMTNGQTVKITGEIADESAYSGNYNNEDIVLTKDFLMFEHTDGLNYVNLEMMKIKDLSKGQTKKIQPQGIAGMAAGILIPKSNVTLWGNEKHDAFHWAGYGFSGKLGLQLNIYQHFFLSTELKGGFIHMPNIRTTAEEVDSASQHFWFTQLNLLFGFNININSQKN